MSQTYTVKQIAEILGYSTNSIYTFIKEKRIKGVRVGKGRFRIPQEELNRILHLSKSPQMVASPVPAVAPTENGNESTLEGIPTFLNHAYVARTAIPSLFDWFLGISSMVLGTSMALFSKFLEGAGVQPFLPWLAPLQVSFFAAGLGILLTDTIRNVSPLWHNLFHAVLALAYVVFALIRWQVGDGDGSILYGLIFLMILANTFSERGGTLIFGLFILLYGLAMPIAIIVNFPMMQNLSFQFITQNSLLFGGIMLLIVLLISAISILVNKRNKIVFVFLTVLVSGILIALSLWYANTLAWQKSVILLVMGLTTLLIPQWEQIRLWHKRDREIVFTLFGGILTVLIISLGIIWVIQNNMLEFSRNELHQKTDYGELLVESTLDSIETTLTETGKNSLLVEAVKKKSNEELIRLLKLTHEGNQQIKNIFVLSDNGDFLANYPYTALTVSNFADREYFKETIATKKTYLSNGFVSKTENREFIVTIAAPVLDKEGSVAGIIAGTLNLDSLSNKLQRIANPQTEEYFVLIDSNAKRLIHPDRTLIGKEIEINNSIRQAITGKEGLNEGYNYKGRLMFQSFGPIQKINWGIGLQAPIAEILQPTRIASIAIFSVVTICVAIIGLFLLLIKGRKFPEEEFSDRPKALQDTS